MTWQTKWTKEQRARAATDGKTLFAVGSDGPDGRFELTGLMDHRLASILILFTANLYSGLSPEEALPKALEEMLEHDGRDGRQVPS